MYWDNHIYEIAMTQDIDAAKSLNSLLERGSTHWFSIFLMQIKIGLNFNGDLNLHVINFSS